MINAESSVRGILTLLAEAERSYATDVQQAKELSNQSLTLCRTLDEPLLLACALDLAGRAAYMSGSLAKAQQYIEEAHTLRQATNDKQAIAISLRNLSNVARLAGEFDQAEALIRQALALFLEMEDWPQLKMSIGRLQAAFVYGGKFDENERLFEQTAPIYGEMGLSKPDAPTIVSAFGMMHLGCYDEAEARFERTLETTPKMLSAYAIKNLGRVALVRGNLDQAQNHLSEALAIFRQSGEVNGLGQTLGSLGILALQRGDLEEAQHAIDENLQMAAETLIVLPSMTALSSLALLRIEEGDAETAVELYAAASQNGHVANSRWYGDVIGQKVEAAADSLSAALIESAQERGSAQSWRTVLRELL